MTNWCREWFSSICVDAVKWRNKIKLIGPNENKGFRVEGLPCWRYTSAGVHKWSSMPSSIFNKFTSGGCWHGICFHHAIAMTAMLQATTKDGWTEVSGYQVRAMRVYEAGIGHAYCELYIKGLGYYTMDVTQGSHYPIVYSPSPRPTAQTMCNMHHRLSDGGRGNMGTVAYNSTWAGFPRDSKTPPVTPPTGLITKSEFITEIQTRGKIDLSKIRTIGPHGCWAAWCKQGDKLRFKEYLFITVSNLNLRNPPSSESDIEFYDKEGNNVTQIDRSWVLAAINKLPFVTGAPITPPKTITFKSVPEGAIVTIAGR